MNVLTKLKKAFMPKIAPSAVGTTALVLANSAFAEGDLERWIRKFEQLL